MVNLEILKSEAKKFFGPLGVMATVAKVPEGGVYVDVFYLSANRMRDPSTRQMPLNMATHIKVEEGDLLESITAKFPKAVNDLFEGYCTKLAEALKKS